MKSKISERISGGPDTKRLLHDKVDTIEIKLTFFHDKLGHMDKIEVVSRVLNVILSTLFMLTLSCQPFMSTL